ncbi:MAG: NADH-quinone oxidoreductase subunit C [Chitinophagales bacterium]|nr:NADH-quinone oxidoreductase subunit C [Chitinophagales bacterium]
MSVIDAALILDKVTNRFGDLVSSSGESFGILTVNCTKDKIIPLLEYLRDDETLAFTFLTDLCGVHYPHRAAHFEVVYHLHSFTNNVRLRIKVALHDPPSIPSATVVFESANWMERETYDFYGIIFEGHPNLKRILNVDEMTIFPMRKQYPLEDNTRKDKNDEMFGRDPKLILAGN